MTDQLVVQIPEKLLGLFQPARYKVAYGGRGSGKSWSFARALLTLGRSRSLRVLCAREVQKSIRESVKRLLDDQIQELGLGDFYESLETEIRGLNGTIFAFAGLASHTVESVKSYEGFDIVWVEEAQTVSKKSWDILIPTIRKPNSEIWISFNPALDTDETWRRFVENTPPNAFVVGMNYNDNPWFSEVLEQERLHCKETSPADYDNIWEGKCRSAVEGAIYAQEVAQAIADGRICPVPYNPKLKAHTVWDLGWNDSMSIIIAQRHLGSVQIIDYIEDSHKTLDYYAAKLKAMPFNWGYDFIPHDGNTKDFKTGKSTAEILRSFGRKTKQTPNIPVESGIKAARQTFPQCYFDKTKAARLVECLRRYRRNVSNITGEPGSPVHDEFSHGCLTGDALIATGRGEIPIREVIVGDRVLTPAGFAKVTASGPTKIATEIIEITLADGRVLKATPEHKIFTTRGVLVANDIRCTDEVYSVESAPCLSSQSIELMGYRDAVIASFAVSGTVAQSSATRIARLRRLGGAEASQLVFDLTVEKHHCYQANGVLVSNSDAFRYLGVVAELMTNEDEWASKPVQSFGVLDATMGY